MTKAELRELRADLGLSQPEMAKELYTSIWTLRAWEQPANIRTIPKAVVNSTLFRDLQKRAESKR